jgi:hypothetical protein
MRMVPVLGRTIRAKCSNRLLLLNHLQMRYVKELDR